MKMRKQLYAEVEPFAIYPGMGGRPALQGEVNRSSRDYIRWVQQSLNRILGLQLAVDGISGTQTRSAIRSFQKQRGLAVDGIVGKQTEAALITAGAGRPPGAASTPGASPSPAPPSPSGGGAVGEQICPEPAKLARDRCLHPGKQGCPAIPNLLCVREIEGTPFEYPEWRQIQKEPRTGLYVIKDRQRNRLQRFIPSVRDALRSFIRNMQRFGMPIEAIITGGSLYCRCITNTDTLSNHSFGDAIDIVGLRWSAVGGPASRLAETIVHNYQDGGERALLRRINACLRLSFATVIDYHRSDHRDHFHCDMNRGRPRSAKGGSTVVFVQEALNVLLRRNLAEDGKFGGATLQALSDFSGRSSTELKSDGVLNQVYDDLFTRVARG
jgi:peptidoglycan hydrolase-like protein with peptidoglycan-binding domain